MFKDRDKMYQVYHTILSMALAWALTIAINEYYVLRVHVLVSALFALIPAALVYLFDMNRKNAMTYLVLLSFFPAAGLLFWIRRINPITWISDIGSWSWQYDGTEELYSVSSAHFLVLGISIAGVILFYLLVKNRFTKPALAIVLLVMLILLSIYHVNLHKIVVGVAIFYMLSLLTELAGKLNSQKTGKPEKKGGILYLAPVCLLLAVLAVWMPSKPEPIQWKGVKNIYYGLKDKIDYLLTEWEFFRGKGQEEFGLALTGYSDEGGKLGNGSLKSSDKIALEISGYAGDSAVYLIGSVSDTYTGNSWNRSKLDSVPEQKDYLLDYFELLYALSRVDSSVMEETRLVERRFLKIEYDNIKTKTFFYPLKSSWYDIYSDTKKPNDEFSSITFPKPISGGSTYQTIFYELNLKDDNFRQMLRDADRFSYETGSFDPDRIQYLEQEYFFHSSTPKFNTQQGLYEALTARAEKIKEYYTTLPEKLPDRVRELADEITAEAETNYDKLKAIEGYLLTYTYNTKPGNLPEGEDFVDYFLFENKQGYCTSFASSMAVLARCVGIPTRYVEGFVMDKGDKEDSRHLVRNRKAHSWAEAYIEGVGWIPFEATPTYYDMRYVQWKKYVKAEDTEEYSFLREVVPEVDLSQFEPDPLTIEKEKKIPSAVIGGIILLATIVTILILLLIYDIILRSKYRKAFKRADYNRRMYLLFLRILAMLKKEGFVLGTEDTILTLSGRIKDLFHYDRVIFHDVAEVFMRYRYAEAEISEKEFRKVEIFYKGLLYKHREETGRMKMHLEEFLFLAKKSNRV